MDSRLLSDDDLVQITGKRRYSTQAAWFKREFGIDVVRRADGRIIITWAAFEALQARRAGFNTAGAGEAPQARPAVYPLRRAAA